MAATQKTDVFQFMAVRSPQSIEPKKLRHFYIRDEYIGSSDETNQSKSPIKTLRDIFSMNSESETGKIIFKKIFCEDSERNIREKGLKEIFNVGLLTKIIYENGVFNSSYQQLRNALFETLYILYILRRFTTINLEYIITGLQTLHTLEFLTADDFLYSIKTGQINLNDQYVKDTVKFLSNIFEELQDLDLTSATNNAYFIHNEQDLLNYFQSTPVIHPIVAKLHWYKQPFNDIKPIGVGDLKVVKQWLCGYKAGEISDIHNIMKGELKGRSHRHLEKTEEVFSFTSEQSEDNQRESQTTDRFEVKKEAETVVKTDLNASAHTDLTYKNDAYGILTNVGGNFAYTNSNEDTQRSASNYARDVMDKAVTQIQNRTTQQRSITKIYETEEINKHTLNNTQQGATHTSGIYRWLDKKYKAQLYNYGRRMMFEFIIPEPAAFYVESKLRATEFERHVWEKVKS